MTTSVYNRPGTFIEERLQPVQPAAAPGAPPAAFVQTAKRGPTTFTRVASWSEFVRLFGGFNGNDVLPHAVFAYFNNGGQVCYICRVIGAGAAVATRTLNDASISPSVVVNAANSGVWGNDLYIDVVAGPAPASGEPQSFSLVVRLGHATNTSAIVERWEGVTMDPLNSRFLEAVINGNSSYITVARAGGTATEVPAAASGLVMASGSDGGAVNDAAYLAAAQQLDDVPEPVMLAAPGVTVAGTINQLITYAEGREDIFVVVDPPVGSTPDNNATTGVVTYAGTLNPASSYAAIYYPWLLVSDPSSAARNATRLIPPSGAVLGRIASTDLRRGVYKAPAGVETAFAGVVSAERKLSSANRDALNVAHVNALWSLPGGGGTVIYGARTMRRTLEADRYVNNRRTLIHLKRAFKDLLAFAPFENNDPALWTRINTSLERYLSSFWQAGGLRGNSAQEAYFVKVDAENNPASSVAQGYLYVDVGVALQFPAEFIVIRLGQFQGATTATELTAA